MRKLLFLTVVSLSLAGCVYPSTEHVAYLNSFVGHPESDLVRNFGVPSRSFETGGSKFLAYHSERIETLPGSGWPGPGWGWWGGGFPPEVVSRECETTFELVAGQVKGWTMRGNDCY